jgi:hypothetical protein
VSTLIHRPCLAHLLLSVHTLVPNVYSRSRMFRTTSWIFTTRGGGGGLTYIKFSERSEPLDYDRDLCIGPELAHPVHTISFTEEPLNKRTVSADSQIMAWNLFWFLQTPG